MRSRAVAATVLVTAALVTAALATVAATPAAAEVAMPTYFSGSCQFNGPIKPQPPITVVPVPGPHFSYNGTGTCTGTLDGKQVSATPLTLTFTNVATLFDTCELGPDFDLHGDLTIGPARQRDLFKVTVDLARLAVAGPFAVTTTGNGLAVGVAQFNPADASTAPQQCATTGVGDASLAASFNTLSALIGSREPAPTPPSPSQQQSSSQYPVAHSAPARARRHKGRRAIRHHRRAIRHHRSAIRHHRAATRHHKIRGRR